MPNMIVLSDIPSYVLPQWEQGLTGAGWKRVSQGAYAKNCAQLDPAVQEVTKIFQTLNVQLEEDDEEHVRICYPGKDQAGNVQLGIKTLFGAKPS